MKSNTFIILQYKVCVSIPNDLVQTSVLVSLLSCCVYLCYRYHPNSNHHSLLEELARAQLAANAR